MTMRWLITSTLVVRMGVSLSHAPVSSPRLLRTIFVIGGSFLLTDLDDMFKRVQEVEVDYSEDCSPSPNDYDLADDAQMDFDLKSEQSSKRQRAGEITVSNLTSRFGSRIPSFSRKWRHRRAGNTKVGDDHSAESGLSRANSTRASSLAGSLVESTELPDPQLPPTPTRNVITGDVETSHLTSIDVQKANAPNDEEDSDRKASTPLLPPILTQISTQVKETPFQSPLQSPTIAPPPVIASHDSPSSLQNPQLRGPSSPPLSTKPSVTSFHCPPGQLQTSEIPPLLITKNDDEWANKLGHANFTILPEPYLPNRYDPPACKRLRSDWDLARCNYMKHLMRAREHYGATSKIYRLIEEKWAEIDSIWKSNYDLTMSRATDAGFGAELSLSQSPIAEPVPLIKLPSLNGPGSEGKFPKLGDEGIVGPMEQLARPLQLRRSSKKAGILKLLHNVLPGHTGFWGRSVRTRSFSP